MHCGGAGGNCLLRMRRWTPRLGPSASEPLRTVLDRRADAQELIACIADPVTKAKPVLPRSSHRRDAPRNAER